MEKILHARFALGDNYRGSSYRALTLIAGDGQTWTLDHDVAASLSAFNGGAPVDGRRTVVGNRVAYLVRDAAEQRTGVWVAELPDSTEKSATQSSQWLIKSVG